MLRLMVNIGDETKIICASEVIMRKCVSRTTNDYSKLVDAIIFNSVSDRDIKYICEVRRARKYLDNLLSAGYVNLVDADICYTITGEAANAI